MMKKERHVMEELIQVCYKGKGKEKEGRQMGKACQRRARRQNARYSREESFAATPVVYTRRLQNMMDTPPRARRHAV